MGSIRTSCNPAQLKWAREDAGLTVEEAAQAIKIDSQILLSAEEGTHTLTLNQLREAAKQYNFPFGYFYFKNTPESKKPKPIPDFRIDPTLQHRSHYKLNLILKKIRDRREVYIDLLKSLDRDIPIFNVLLNNQNIHIGTQIRQRLNVNDHEISKLTYDTAYSYWKAKVENDGVLVYESDQIPDETGVIGAALFYQELPIILIKRGGNFHERKLFTLLHEYAHLLYGESAINDSESITVDFDQNSAASIESKCNSLAAEILAPTEKINKSLYIGRPPSEMMAAMAKKFKITFSTAAVCLRKNKLIQQSDFDVLLKQRKIEHQKKNSKKGTLNIPRENLMRLDLGRPMFSAVIDSYSNGSLSVLDVSGLLGLRVNKIYNLLKERH